MNFTPVNLTIPTRGPQEILIDVKEVCAGVVSNTLFNLLCALLVVNLVAFMFWKELDSNKLKAGSLEVKWSIFVIATDFILSGIALIYAYNGVSFI